MKRKLLIVGALIAMLWMGLAYNADARCYGRGRGYGYGYNRPHRVWMAPPPPPRYGYYRPRYYGRGYGYYRAPRPRYYGYNRPHYYGHRRW